MEKDRKVFFKIKKINELDNLCKFLEKLFDFIGIIFFFCCISS